MGRNATWFSRVGRLSAPSRARSFFSTSVTMRLLVLHCRLVSDSWRDAIRWSNHRGSVSNIDRIRRPHDCSGPGRMVSDLEGHSRRVTRRRKYLVAG